MPTARPPRSPPSLASGPPTWDRAKAGTAAKQHRARPDAALPLDAGVLLQLELADALDGGRDRLRVAVPPRLELAGVLVGDPELGPVHGLLEVGALPRPPDRVAERRAGVRRG